MEKSFITIKEAAKILGVSKLTLRNWDKAGKLNALRHPINNYRVYQLEDIEKITSLIISSEKPPRPPKKDKSEVWKIKVNHISD